MAVEYSFTRVNPLCICDEDDNLKTQSVEVSMKAWDTTSHGTVLEAYANGEVALTGVACVDPEDLDVPALCNQLAVDEDWKVSLAAQITAQKETAVEWTGHLENPDVT